MAFDADLLAVAGGLLERRPGQRGPLSRARIRRSISTSYYALFHFVCLEVTRNIVGASGPLRVRRRILARALTHRGIKTTLDKVGIGRIDPSVRDFMSSIVAAPNTQAPTFVSNLAVVFADTQAKRHDADYDLNKVLSEADARITHGLVRRAIDRWKTASSLQDRDFKRAMCTLILMKGQLRSE